MTGTHLAAIFSALLISISNLQAAETATHTQKLNEWCTLTYPTQIEVGKPVKLKVVYKGLKKAKLYCDLHWKDIKGKKRGFMTGGSPRLEAEGDGERTFTAKISKKPDLGTVFPLIFTTPTGKWQDKKLSVIGPDISIKGVVVIKSSAKKKIVKAGAAPQLQALRPDSGLEYTQKLQQALLKDKRVVIPAGNYLIKFNEVKIPSGAELVGANRKTVFTGYGATRKKGTSAAILTIEGADNISISGIIFKGQNNSAIAIKVINSVSRPSHHIKVNNNTAIEIGLLFSGPRKGFTFNRSRGQKKGWAHQGGVTKQMINYDIVVKNNICFGNRKFKPGNFKKGKKPGVSCITFMYTKNALAENNLIANYRFGIWAYGGAPKDSTNKRFSGSPLLCENIVIKDNCVSETFSPVWVSNTDQFEFSNNCASRTQDVAYDIEGSANGKIFNNISIDANGGSLTPLNGSRDSLFENNAIYEFRVKAPNICVVRDGNRQIIFRKNNFIRKEPLSEEEHSKVLIKNIPGSKMPPNEDILFEHNYFENVILKPKSGKKIVFKDNNFIRSKFIKIPGVDPILQDNNNAETGTPNSEIVIRKPQDKSVIKASMPGSIVAEIRNGSQVKQIDFWLILPDQRWLALGKTKSASYSKKLPANLIPGDYKAIVRATNSRGVASFDVVAFKLIKTEQ